jgi:hypothetical protein
MGTLNTISAGDVYLYSTGGRFEPSGDATFTVALRVNTNSVIIFPAFSVPVQGPGLTSFSLDITYTFLVLNRIVITAQLMIGSVGFSIAAPATVYQNQYDVSTAYPQPLTFDVLANLEPVGLVTCNYGVLNKLYQ